MFNYLKYIFIKIWLKLKGFFKKTKLDNIIFEYYVNNVFKKKLEKMINENNDKIENFVLKIKKFDFLENEDLDNHLTNLLNFKNIDKFCRYLINRYNENL